MTHHVLTKKDIQVANTGSPDDLKVYINDLRLEIAQERDGARRLSQSVVNLVDRLLACEKGEGELKS